MGGGRGGGVHLELELKGFYSVFIVNSLFSYAIIVEYFRPSTGKQVKR